MLHDSMRVHVFLFASTFFLGLFLCGCDAMQGLDDVNKDIPIGQNKPKPGELKKTYDKGPLTNAVDIQTATDNLSLDINPEDIGNVSPDAQKQAQEIINPGQGQVAGDSQQAQGSNQLQGQDLVVGTGDEAINGKTVTVHYTGVLTNGQKFDSSLDRGEPFSFTLGSGQVIKGWDIGVKGMKVGGKRKLIIPPSYGYGDQATGSIPPNSILIFEIELLKVE